MKTNLTRITYLESTESQQLAKANARIAQLEAENARLLKAIQREAFTWEPKRLHTGK